VLRRALKESHLDGPDHVVAAPARTSPAENDSDALGSLQTSAGAARTGRSARGRRWI